MKLGLCREHMDRYTSMPKKNHLWATLLFLIQAKAGAAKSLHVLRIGRVTISKAEMNTIQGWRIINTAHKAENRHTGIICSGQLKTGFYGLFQPNDTMTKQRC